MKLLGAHCFLSNLIFLIFMLAFHTDRKVAQADIGREAIYDVFYIQEPCEQNRVISAGQGGHSRYGFIRANPTSCIEGYQDCSIYVNVSLGYPNYHILSRFQYLAMDCNSGALDISASSGSSSYCGYNTPPNSLYSTSNWLGYRFVTYNVSTCQSGFSLYYTVVHTNECTADEFRCEIDGRCIPNEVICDTYGNCGDWSDETSDVCRAKFCNGTSYHGQSGVISSPNYPGNYSNYFSCDYYINASSSSSSIAIIFKAFDTEECCDNVTISCATNPIYPSVRYSGSFLPQPLSIPWCREAVINFVTNNSTVSTGFSLDYHISLGGCGDTVYTGSNGIVTSPNYPSVYDNNQNCSNIIWSRRRSTFAITFQYIDVEECCDFVELSCLDNADFESYRFTGNTVPTKLEIPRCTQVLVWFYSDDTVVQDGFNLEYIATLDPDNH